MNQFRFWVQGVIMSLKFISQYPANEGKITIPRGANIVRVKGRLIQFFRGNEHNLRGRVYQIPQGAREVSFPGYHFNQYTVYYGNVEFHNGDCKRDMNCENCCMLREQ